MSINPPSDILLDVARAADPAKSATATERLSRLAADRGAADTQFADVFSDTKAPGQAPLAAIASPRFANEAPEKARDIAETKAYQGIGALLLGSLVENMLPESDEFFGQEAGAGMWRSMLAQELGTSLSKNLDLSIGPKHGKHAHHATHPVGELHTAFIPLSAAKHS